MDVERIMLIQNDLFMKLTIARNIDQIVRNALDWLICNIGKVNIAIWAATSEREPGFDFKFVGYMKYQNPGEEHFLAEVHDALLQDAPFKTDSPWIPPHIIDCNDAETAPGLSSILLLENQTMIVMRANYLGEPLILAALFRNSFGRPEAFSSDDLDTITVFQNLFPTMWATLILRHDNDTTEEDEDAEASSGRDDEWWKRGEESPY
jgi:hypothetical protein